MKFYDSLRIVARMTGLNFIKQVFRLSLIIPLLTLGACFTGVESTKKIALSKADRKILQPSAEELLMNAVTPQPLGKWAQGKSFFIVSDRAAMLLHTSGGGEVNGADIEGAILSFEGVTDSPAPDGTRKAMIMLRGGDRLMVFDTGREYNDALQHFMSDRLPMMVDVDMLTATDSLIKGRTLWTRSAVWNDADGQRYEGRKFVPVTVTAVLPGSAAFPAQVQFRDENGQDAFMFLNFGASSGDSRSFADLFFLTDPKLRYPKITAHVWQLIQHGALEAGMTKEEAKLSLGNPDEVMAGHDYSQTLDIWRYNDGSMLRFADGLLIDFRH
ncbi:MAG: hypothetical protein K2H47_08000 [Muribaculaceae bacterium]|nr:hypothetical protein [Muribaculaceae bacterium]